MNAQQVEIVAVRDTSVLVSVGSAESCGGCRSKSSCGSGSVREIEITPELGATLRKGDQLDLSLPEGLPLKAAAMAYLPPLGGFLLGIAVGAVWSGQDGLTMLGGCLGLAAGSLLSHVLGSETRRAFKIGVKPSACGPRRA